MLAEVSREAQCLGQISMQIDHLIAYLDPHRLICQLDLFRLKRPMLALHRVGFLLLIFLFSLANGNL